MNTINTPAKNTTITGIFFHRNFKYTYSKQKLLGNQVMLRLFDNLKSAVFVIEIRGVWHSVLSASLHG